MTTSSKAAIDHAPAKFRPIIIDAADGETMNFYGMVSGMAADPGAKKVQMRAERALCPLRPRLRACNVF
jgi:hypothetical protein